MINLPNYYAILPAIVRYDNELSPQAKLIYAEINSLANALGYAFCSNAYLANVYDISTRTITRIISQLELSGYIRVYYIDDARRLVPLAETIRTAAEPEEPEPKKESEVVALFNKIYKKRINI